MDNQLDQLEYG